MFSHFIHLCHNSRAKICALPPGRVTVAIRRQWLSRAQGPLKASVWAQPFSVAHRNCFPLERCHQGSGVEFVTFMVFFLSLKGQADLVLSPSWKWIELAEDFLGWNLPFVPQVKSDQFWMVCPFLGFPPSRSPGARFLVPQEGAGGSGSLGTEKMGRGSDKQKPNNQVSRAQGKSSFLDLFAFYPLKKNCQGLRMFQDSFWWINWFVFPLRKIGYRVSNNPSLPFRRMLILEVAYLRILTAFEPQLSQLSNEENTSHPTG